nr:hypothetical protein [uncultured Acetatifactor sp.]
MKKKIGIMVALILIVSIGFGISRIVQNPKEYKTADPTVKTIMDTCEVNQEQAENIWKILQDCGVGSIKTISHDKMLDGLYSPDDIGYRIRTHSGNDPVLYLNSSGEVNIVRWADQILYPKS